MNPVLFLDYDGILHPPDVRVTKDEPRRPRVYTGGHATDHALFEHAPLLERVLQPFPQVKISLSTSWVRALGYEFALQQLPLGLRSRVVGTIWRDWLLKYPPRTRHDAITTAVEAGNISSWIALDDDVEGWPEERRHFVVAPTNAWYGLGQPGVTDELAEALERLCAGRSLQSGKPKILASLSTIERLFGLS